MKNILEIFRTDLNNIRKKRAAIVVIVALMILPSMYAWFNIIPSWDPYSNTSDVSVAVVNKDEGATIEGDGVNVGDEIILSLMDNKKLGWTFVDEEEAMKGVQHGDYYASIIIPEDFSEKLSSVLDDEPEQPVLDYYINEKINAIAPKVTGAGASGIVESIQTGFVKVANEAIFTAFNDIGIELESNRASIEQFRDAVYQMEADLPEVERILGVANTDVVRVEESVVKVNDGIKKAEEMSKSAEQLSDRLEKILADGEKTFQTYVPLVKQDLRLAQKAIQQIPTLTSYLTKKGEDADAVLDKVIKSTAKIDDSTDALRNLADLLERADDRLTTDPKLVQLIEELTASAKKMDELQESLEIAIEKLKNGDHLGTEVVENLNQLAEDIEADLAALISSYEKTLKNIEAEIENFRGRVTEILEAVKPLKEKNDEILVTLKKWIGDVGPISIEQQQKMIEQLQVEVGKSLEEVKGKLEELKEISGELEEEDIQLNLEIKALEEIQTTLQGIEDKLKEAQKSLESGNDLTKGFWEDLYKRFEAIDAQFEGLSTELNGLSQNFDAMLVELENHAQAIRENLLRLQDTAEAVSDLTSRLVEVVGNPEKTLAVLEDTVARIQDGKEVIATAIELGEKLQQAFDDGIFLDGADRILNLAEDLQTFKAEILRVTDHAKETKKAAGESLAFINQKSAEMDNEITKLIRYIDQDLMPKYEEASKKANNALKEGNKILTKANTYFPQVHETLKKVEESVEKGKDGLSQATTVFPEAKEKITELAKRVRMLEEKGDLDQIIKLLKNDPTAESEFFSEPLLLDEHELFPIPNYGSAMAPFFTAMSLWVGGLILVSSLIVDVPNKQRYKSYETYFGRILTFWAIGIAQAFIVTVGNMLLLKTFVAHKILFVLFGFLISIVFVTIIYTFVSVFGNSGKVVAIILLVMQLGASGGTFPIQMTPMFFQKIHGFLPFTHALGLFREAIGGVIWPIALTHIAWLIGYMGLFLFIGIKLKERINRSSDKFLEEARESEIIL